MGEFYFAPSRKGRRTPYCKLCMLNLNKLYREKQNKTNPNFVNGKYVPHKLSPESKLKISIARKKYLKENPDKHPWRKNSKFKSVPCEKFKEYLDKNNIKYISELNPEIPDHNYSIDIAFPNKMIAIEINGSQHYNRDGTLKEYYQIRENLLKLAGWNVYQIHYSFCFKEENFSLIMEKINKQLDFAPDNYEKYFQRKLELKQEKLKKELCSCGNKKLSTSLKCKKCSDKFDHKLRIVLPEIEVIHWKIWNYSCIQAAEQLGVSDGCLVKRLKKYSLSVPSKGYFQKLKNGIVTDYQI